MPVLVAILAISGCGSTGKVEGGPGGTRGRVTLSAEKIPAIGNVLVSEGETLYVFAPDRGKEVTCAGSCAQAWPPLTLPAGQKEADASGAVKGSLIGTLPGPEGGRVVTYAGWPLYRFVSDTEPGEANGQNVNLNGGYWWVISPSGKIIRK